MPKKPGLSDLTKFTKKLNINKVVGNVKSIISPTGDTPDADEDDELGQQLAELSLLVQEMLDVHEQQSSRMEQVNKLFNEVFKDIEAERAALRESEPEDDDDDEEES